MAMRAQISEINSHNKAAGNTERFAFIFEEARKRSSSLGRCVSQSNMGTLERLAEGRMGESGSMHPSISKIGPSKESNDNGIIDPQNVIITPVGDLTIDQYGLYRWDVSFSLPQPASQDGFIIQHIEATYNFPETWDAMIGNWQPALSEYYNFFETWAVLQGARTPTGHVRWDDSFARYAGPCRGNGSIIIHGIARFYEIPDLPASFIFNNPHPACVGATNLPCSVLRPSFWTGVGTRHDVDIRFDCVNQPNVTMDPTTPVRYRISPRLQPKLLVNLPCDEHEREANWVAEHIMNMRESFSNTGIMAPLCMQGKACSQQLHLVDHRAHAGRNDNPLVHRVTTSSGHPFDLETRNFMEARFGYDFSGVRLHTDSEAARSARSVNALAYTLGKDIVFGKGQYDPRSITGLTLIAHELTHVIQQQQFGNNLASNEESSEHLSANFKSRDNRIESRCHCPLVKQRTDTILQRDIDPRYRRLLSILSDQRLRQEWHRLEVMLSILRVGCATWIDVIEQQQVVLDVATERGLTLIRPSEFLEQPPDRVTAESRMLAHIQGLLTDNQLQPSDWQNIRRYATELNIDETGLIQILEGEDLDFDPDFAALMAFLSSSDNPAIERFIRIFSTNVIQGPPLALESDPISGFLIHSLENGALDINEFEAFRRFCQLMGIDYMDIILESSSMGNDAQRISSFILQMSDADFQTLASTGSIFPISISTGLCQRILRDFVHSGICEHCAFGIIRILLENLSRREATSLLERSGLVTEHAQLLAAEFTSASYQHDVEARPLLTLAFQQTGRLWELTPESYQNWILPWWPQLVHPLVSAEGHPERRAYVPERVRHLGSYRFRSGLVRNSEEIDFNFQERTIPLVVAEELAESDWSILSRIETALSALPERHVALIQRLVLDPGYHPRGRSRIASASRENNTINIFLNGAGPDVPQNELNNTAAHELGHVVSYHSESADPTFWDRWEEAMEDDRIAISRYGFTSRGEDFAESYLLYLSGGRSDRSTRQRYANRFAILDRIIEAE
ncbi:MAG: hypothetical protein A4E49_02516 [Methanosaeta sp. PtaU1.Bin112]|nr:MAG: hypothetical protein A4E49_02516 [Methanosaeta sp. PtaU1.Bin112]